VIPKFVKNMSNIALKFGSKFEAGKEKTFKESIPTDRPRKKKICAMEPQVFFYKGTFYQ
jgi:hypothetical protein